MIETEFQSFSNFLEINVHASPQTCPLFLQCQNLLKYIFFVFKYNNRNYILTSSASLPSPTFLLLFFLSLHFTSLLLSPSIEHVLPLSEAVLLVLSHVIERLFSAFQGEGQEGGEDR